MRSCISRDRLSVGGLLAEDFLRQLSRLFLRLADDAWEKINFELLLQRAKRRVGTEPSAGVIDSQSAKTTESGGRVVTMRQEDQKGRKRHIVTDTCGLLSVPRCTPPMSKIGWCRAGHEASTSCFPGYATCLPTASTTAPTCVRHSPIRQVDHRDRQTCR